ncbi:MAG: NADH-quinone oxidoreductase subunit NuoH [Chloroflexi bacterium]|nr:NADH-quinone oxidoreductase subunit NuoH [Chloroflexota bacterium]MCI0818583.1 NADH-quinone oxidoreductase subunit NuoH [Chloroflexota bacterium]MCI0819708.1 NADH-quinone oxidoreductase subunit NuoH [Chloroflexota bacterium]MCI0832057.1 NADH-quinone oxidoreductase subunit NuoH [Chloroflexota bacterium]MCI0843020.1 NADH-quinone oxidoreductase subunit NuoH [Chloroflexota bacterium]
MAIILSGEWYDLRDLANPIRELIDALGAPDAVDYVLWSLIAALAILIWLVVSVIAFIWIERRLVALMQNRKGPNRVGPAGLLQPIADAIKLLLKEAITTRDADRILFWLAPIIVFIPTVVVFAVVPFGESMVLADLNVGVLFLIAVAGIMTPAVFIAGWSSNNKYALLAAMRAIAMLISYELIQVLALLAAVLFIGSMNLQAFVSWQDEYNTWLIFILPLPVVAYVIAGAVEINRSPMDLSEAESELAAGYHTEYGGIKFGFFYQAEYMAGFAIAATVTTLFLGGWTLWGLEEWIPGWIIFLGKLYAVFFLYIWSRGTLPRLRIDQLMAFAWKFMLPLMLVNALVIAVEVVVWEETGASRNVALPAIGAVNATLAVILVIGWARVLGHGSGLQRGYRATLTREIGKIYYTGAEVS